MGILEALERTLLNKAKTEKVPLKEIVCKRKDGDFINRFNTAAVGCEYTNPDGSERQDALKKLKEGERIRLIWDSGDANKKDIVYLVRRGKGREISMPDCFGRLNDKVAADVVRWLNQEETLTSAVVSRITGGTRRRSKLGCVLELTTYPSPDAKK